MRGEGMVDLKSLEAQSRENQKSAPVFLPVSPTKMKSDSSCCDKRGSLPGQSSTDPGNFSTVTNFSSVTDGLSPLKPLTNIQSLDNEENQGCCTTTANSLSQKRSTSNNEYIPSQKDPYITDASVGIREYFGMIRCRLTSVRNSYMVSPGLYAYCNPDSDSEVFVTANYKYSFDILRKHLGGMPAWILVLDTKGINVWCAAGKGSFGTSELVARIKSSALSEKVSHKRVIVPQLGAPGIRGREVKRVSGFRVIYGPVEASDITEFVKNDLKASGNMRQVGFGFFKRMELVPMEMRPYFKHLVILLGAMGVVFSIISGKGSFVWPDEAYIKYMTATLLAYVTGTALVPLLLPYIPSRSFAVKGAITGLLVTLALYSDHGINSDAVWSELSAIFVLPAMSSFLALQFTGSTTFTGMTGVTKELQKSLPFHLTGVVIGGLFLAVSIIREFFV